MIPILSGNVASATASTGYTVDNSCRWNDGDLAYMHKTFGTSTDVDKCTISVWVKRCVLGATKSIVGSHTNDNNRVLFGFEADQLQYRQVDGGSTTVNLITTQVFRDVSAWYHIVLSVDTGQGTAANRIRLYVNGSEVTSFGTETNPSQDLNFGLNNSNIVLKLVQQGEQNDFFDGYMSEFVFIDGQQLTPTSFGEFDSDSPTIWKPKDVSGLTFGTNGFYLDFKDSSNLGNDANGGTDLTEVNLAATDQATDTPTNNFATWNPLHYTSATLSEGNLKAQSTNGNYISGVSTIGVSTSKWYAEFKLEAESATGESIIGVTGLVRPTSAIDGQTGNFGMRNYNGLIIYTSSGSAYNNSSQHGGFTTNDIMGVGLDMDNGRVYFSKNGGWWNGSSTWGGSTPSSYITLQTDIFEEFFFLSGDAGASVNATWNANFGSPQFTISSGNADANGYGNFEYAVPSGYLALCTKNLGSDGWQFIQQ